MKDHMSNAMANFASMYDRLHSVIDDPKPSTMAAASEDNDAANTELDRAIHLARLHYIAMGGKWNDITDGKSEAPV